MGMSGSLHPKDAGNTRTLFLVVLAIAAAAAVGVAFSPLAVLRRSSETEIQVSGNIEAHESVLSFKAVQSRIVELPFDEGQWVQEGALLARLEDADYRQQVFMDAAGLQVQERQLSANRQILDAATKTVLADEADLAQKSLDFKRAQRLRRQHVESTELWVPKIRVRLARVPYARGDIFCHHRERREIQRRGWSFGEAQDVREHAEHYPDQPPRVDKVAASSRRQRSRRCHDLMTAS
jgi:multidrug efflux pump subunit AcrA (membrane-fusion protein)